VTAGERVRLTAKGGGASTLTNLLFSPAPGSGRGDVITGTATSEAERERRRGGPRD
jgi:hypothetical protein